MTTIFLLDDHEIVRRGLRDLLESADDLKVIGEAGTASDALMRIASLQPDVAVLDVRLPDESGVGVCREIRSLYPQISCLILTSFSDDEALFSAIMAGASGYLLKQIRSNDLIDAVQRVAKGESLLDPTITKRVLERMQTGSTLNDPLESLTEQERRIFTLIGDGKTNRQIAENMCLAEKTIKNYVSNLLSKLGMERRTEAAAYAGRLDERKKISGHQ